MVLSIGMIVKNEEKYLERCLTALQPILREIDSELIIADTGSTDRTVEIAKKFTDKVFHFEWINDFAAARNSTLEKAQGEWYMFVDADEIAQDCTDLIAFFKTGMYKQVSTASVIQRNYGDENNWDVYSDLRVMRMVKRIPETRFDNAIHEHLNPIISPVLQLKFVLDHYGYVFTGEEGKEFAKQKSQRNLEILFDELEEGTHDYIYIVYAQIADCYGIIGDFENALKYLKMGLEKVGHQEMFAAAFYSKIITTLAKLERYDEILEVSDEYFDIKINPFHTQELAADCYIRGARGSAYCIRKEYHRAIDEFIKFFDLYRRYNSGELDTPDLYMSEWNVNAGIFKSFYDVFFRCCYEEKRFDLANKYAQPTMVKKFADIPEVMKNHLNIHVEMMEELGYDGLDELYEECDEAGKEHLLLAVSTKAPVTATKNRATLIKKLKALGGKAADIAKIYKGYYDNAPEFGRIKTFLQKYGTLRSADLLYIMLEKQMDIAPFLLANDFSSNVAASALSESFPKGIEMFENYDIDKIDPEGLAKAANLYGQIVLEAVKKERIIAPVFEKYGELGMKWLTIFGGNVPGDVFLALIVNNVVTSKRNGDREQFDKSMNDLKKRVPMLGPPADSYAQEVEDSFGTV